MYDPEFPFTSLNLLFVATGCLLPRSRRADTYLLCGEALRLCTVLSLNHEPPSLLPPSDLTSIKSSLEPEEQRRRFWYCHVCCLISSNLDLWAPMVLPPSEITTSYPFDEELWLSAKEHTILDNPRTNDATWVKNFVNAMEFLAQAAGTL